MAWKAIEAPPGLARPKPMAVRAQSTPRAATSPSICTRGTMVYAISGVLTVAVEGGTFAISPEQAIWLPTGLRHRVGSLLGAEFRSLWIADEAGRDLPDVPTVFGVTPLLKALIVEVTALEGQQDRDGYAGRVTLLILDQLRRAQPLLGALPWPRGGSSLTALCEALYQDPADPRGPGPGGGNWGCRNGPSPATSRQRWA